MSRKFMLISLLIIFLLLFASLKSSRENTNPIRVAPLIVNPDKLFNLDFEYVINNSCDYDGNSNLSVVVLVTSYLGNVETRSAMRRAFPSDVLKKLGVRRVFLLGLAPGDKYTKQEAIYDEERRFGDLLQGNFVEAYRNLTYKHLMGLKWAAASCQRVKYVIKMDDDIVVNVYKLLQLLHTIKLPKKLLAGYLLSGMTPIRESSNKWYIRLDEFKYPSYPTFLSGWFYVTNPNTVQSLVKESTKVPYFWVDDVYITGLLAQKSQVRHYNIGQYFTVHSEFLECCMRDVKKFWYDCDIIVGPNGGDNNLFYKFNDVVSECYYRKCSKRIRSLNETCVGEVKRTLGRGNSIISSYQLG
uniref:Hexosyltransferase n=1 Tax=Photinus pyralis TaxID=7054 RepID=A0A1Y1M0V1_PHOPY